MATDAALQGIYVRASQGSPAGLDLHWPDRPPLAIHPLWLRERCRDAASLDLRTEQRLYNPADLDPDLAIVSVVPLAADRYRVAFSDGKVAVFCAHAILAEIASPAADVPQRTPWTVSLNELPLFDWNADPSDSARLAMLERFLSLGFIVLRDVPSEDGAVVQVARRFGFPRETNFGVMFDVRSVPEAGDLAYTPLALDPHTDNPYRDPVPGIQLLHCLANRCSGGLSTLVDGLAVAEALAAESPEALHVLARTPVRFRYVDSSTELVETAPIVRLDAAGGFVAIHYSPRLDSTPLLPPDELASFYGARRVLDRMLRSDRFERRFRLDDRDLVMFDNRRLLHGRTEFDPAEGLRHLQGCYIDGDGPRSLYRVLRRRQAGASA